MALVHFSGPKFILPKFGNFLKIWHQMLTLKNKGLGMAGKDWERLPLVGLEKGMVYWLGKVRLGMFRLVLLAI